MSSLTDIEKRYLEKLLDMAGGHVLDFTDATFGALFERHNVNIHGQKYQTIGTSGTSKAKNFAHFGQRNPMVWLARFYLKCWIPMRQTAISMAGN